MTERTVRVVQPTRHMHTLAPLSMHTRRKAACYLRISTASDEQENSLENQRQHYMDLLQNSPDLEFAGCYYDDGVSGTGTAHRHGFQQMVKDALDGKFSLILTKSLSRFSRNVVDTVSTVRLLKEHGVEVQFDKEHLSSFDSKSELFMTILCSLAQDESRSISENVTWGMRQGFAQGKIQLPYSSFLGYRKGEDGPEIVPEEATVVQTIYRRYLDGQSPGTIAKELEKAGVPSPTGRKRWHDTTVNSILTNPCYKGLTIRQKTYTTDFLTHKIKKNEGELPQYIIENSHPAIIPEETWELVQVEMERRKAIGRRFSGKGALACRLVCADCGAFFGAKVWHSTDSYRATVWRCNNKYNRTVERASGGDKCNTGHVTEEGVYKAFGKIVRQLIAQKPEVVAACEEILRELIVTTDLDKRKDRLEGEESRIRGKAEALMDRASRELVENFSEAYGTLEKQLKSVNEKLEAVETERRVRELKARQCRLYLKKLIALGDDGITQSNPGTETGEVMGFSETFLALVDKVMVGEKLTFVLKDGTEWTVER